MIQRVQRHPLRWLPNALTAARLLLLPLLLALLGRVHPTAGPGDPDRIALLALFTIMALTDWLDGTLARRLDATSRIGSMADAVADRLLLLLPLGYLALGRPPAFAAVPLWLPGGIVALDLLLGLAWVIGRSSTGAAIPRTHRQAGRVSVWAFSAAILAALAALPDGLVAGLGLTGLALSAASLVGYARLWLVG